MIARAAVRHVARHIMALGVSFVLTLTSCLKVPTGADAQESHDVISALVARYTFRVMSSHDPRPAVYGRPHPDYTQVYVYGDYNWDERSQIFTHTRAVRREKATKAIYLYFYPRELEETDLLQQEMFP